MGLSDETSVYGAKSSVLFVEFFLYNCLYVWCMKETWVCIVVGINCRIN